MVHITILCVCYISLVCTVKEIRLYRENDEKSGIIRASVDALCRDGTSEISRDPCTKCLQTRRESLARPSKHTNNNF